MPMQADHILTLWVVTSRIYYALSGSLNPQFPHFYMVSRTTCRFNYLQMSKEGSTFPFSYNKTLTFGPARVQSLTFLSAVQCSTTWVNFL